MRRKLPYDASLNTRGKSAAYGAAVIALFGYALPKIPHLQRGVPGTFSFLWIALAGLALAANAYFFLGADRERSRMLEELESATESQWETSPAIQEQRRAQL